MSFEKFGMLAAAIAAEPNVLARKANEEFTLNLLAQTIADIADMPERIATAAKIAAIFQHFNPWLNGDKFVHACGIDRTDMKAFVENYHA